MKRVSALAIVFAVAATSLVARQGEDPQVRKEIQQHYGTWDKLIVAGDLKKIWTMFDPSFVQTDQNGHTMNLAQTKKQFESMVKSVKDGKCRTVVNQIQAQGNEVVAWISLNASFKMKQGEKWVPMSFSAKFAETLRKINGQWKWVASQELP